MKKCNNPECNKEINPKNKYCSSSCSAKINNKLRQQKQTTKNKISNKLKAINKNIKKEKIEELLKYSKENLKLLSFEEDIVFFKCLKCNKKEKVSYSAFKRRKYKCKSCIKSNEVSNIKKLLLKNKCSLINEEDLILKNQQEIMKFKCNCGKVFSRRLHNVLSQNSYECNECIVNTGTSKQEKELLKNIKKEIGKNKKYSLNNKKIISPYELDIYIEDENSKKIAIEYNGLMFHSFGKSKTSKFNNYKDIRKKENSHLKKTELCENKNIKLFHINENEFLNKKDIVLSMIKNNYNNNQRIGARDTYIKELKTKKEKSLKVEFLNNNHMQGNISSSMNIGLFLKKDKYNLKKDTLVSVMTFGKPRFNKEYEIELYRFASILNYNIIGAASKLLKYYENNYKPKSMISYGNRRWTNKNKNIYLKLDFQYKNETKPGFVYFHENNLNKLYHRMTFQKHKLLKYYEDYLYNIKKYDKKLTAEENIFNNGYRKIYDSGNLVYIKTYP